MEGLVWLVGPICLEVQVVQLCKVQKHPSGNRSFARVYDSVADRLQKFGADGDPLDIEQNVSSSEFLGVGFGVEQRRNLCVCVVGEDGIPMLDVKLNPTSV